MSFLRFASSFPIVGPHHGFEAELLVAGKKPIGMFVDLIVPGVASQDMPPHILQSRNDIQRLSQMSATGKLISTKFEIDDASGAIQTWHFFCQPGNELEMHELEIGTLKAITCPEEEHPFPQSRDQGAYLGYRDIDIEFFKGGGFHSRNALMGQLLAVTNDRRRRAYVSLLLEDHLER